MEEAICYCNNAKLTIESFSYLGQLNNYITLLIQPVRKFFRAGCYEYVEMEFEENFAEIKAFY